MWGKASWVVSYRHDTANVDLELETSVVNESSDVVRYAAIGGDE